MSFALDGEQVELCTKEFLSSEDGNDFISRLEGVSDCFAQAFAPHGVFPSQVDHFLAIVRKDRTATVYCNELNMVALVRAKGRIEKGGAVTKDNLADVARIEFRDNEGKIIDVPSDCGLALVFSVGWRKGVYYDYSVFPKDAPDRTDDLSALFGQFYARLLFQEIYSITEDQWQRMTEWGWFPFIWMSTSDRTKLIDWATQTRDPRPVLEEICNNFRKVIADRVESWRTNTLLSDHMEFIESAKQNYLAENYIGTIQVLFPRIEGVMRKLFALEKPNEKATQDKMVSNLVTNQFVHSVLLPNRFHQYVLEFFFRNFDEQAGKFPLSRHSVAHGTSLAADYDFVRASVGFMILDQIYYYLTANRGDA